SLFTASCASTADARASAVALPHPDAVRKFFPITPYDRDTMRKVGPTDGSRVAQVPGILIVILDPVSVATTLIAEACLIARRDGQQVNWTDVRAFAIRLRRRFFQHQVAVGSAEAEGTHPGDAAASDSRFPLFGCDGNSHCQVVPSDMRAGGFEMQVTRD